MLQNSLRAGVTTLVLATLLACAAPAAAPGAAPPSAPAGSAAPVTDRPPALQALVDAARQEGEIDLVWGEGSVGGREGTRRLTDGLNREYGLNLDVRFTPGPSFPEMAARITQEYQAGRRATSDVYIGADHHISGLMANNVLEAVDWSAWAPHVRDPALVAPQGMAVTFETWLPGITYNTVRVTGDAVPRTLQDLLKPEYKGRVASTPYASGFDRLASPEVWGKARTLDFATRLADQLAGLIRCNETQRIVSGEFDVFALDCNGSNALKAKAQGAPIEFTPALDVPVANLVYMAVPKNAAHPAAAKLWIDYVLSREGQDILFAEEYMDSHLVPGSRTAQQVEKLQASGATLEIFDVARVQSRDEAELADVLPEVQRILSKK
ncbi:MAG TPA: ABC transporter substrate-binding protein [Chloroflexota bacterium]|nr:ABC transporter substrate-binding protein [Chloroflexota bacterium]